MTPIPARSSPFQTPPTPATRMKSTKWPWMIFTCWRSLAREASARSVLNHQISVCKCDSQVVSPSLSMKVMLAKHKQNGKVFAVKVISKKAVKQRDEVKHIMAGEEIHLWISGKFAGQLVYNLSVFLPCFLERNVLMNNAKHPFLVGLRYSFQTAVTFFRFYYFLSAFDSHFTFFPSRLLPG